MRTNQAAIELIKKFEGFRPTVYNDQGGKPTIGYGHLIKAGEVFTTITLAAAEQILAKDVVIAEGIIKKYVQTKLNENQFSALVAFVFNIGEKDFITSTLLKYLNQQLLTAVPEQILRWHYVKGCPSKGLVARRAAEAILFLT